MSESRTGITSDAETANRAEEEGRRRISPIFNDTIEGRDRVPGQRAT
jgi:hypothetical protein